MDMTLWNIVLTAGLAFIGWWGNTLYAEIRAQAKLISKTREEFAKEYVTKQEVHNDIDRLMKRLDALDAKIDRLIENQVRD